MGAVCDPPSVSGTAETARAQPGHTRAVDQPLDWRPSLKAGGVTLGGSAPRASWRIKGGHGGVLL